MNGARRTIMIALHAFAALTFAHAAFAAAPQPEKVPKVVLYTAWYCDSCKAAGEYMAQRHIPFVKKDVDLNENYMQELSTRYKINAVPVIVIGNDDKVLRGFNRDVFDRAVKEVASKTKEPERPLR
ncbi:glutaredoxin family protein [Geomesophilobacter sediminis]|uniref:Glutaredoxin family protein n=1 Tax=Geomesophilobacter sediminis TaxID=2798584 RepID=A0A8J7LY91_9BACT|nr:glutaredoxin family protein [Geomesophilobacter sediminis]MBJ6724327.1 glutaredoxin family protein [Geomesophilobacter sediminis]